MIQAGLNVIAAHGGLVFGILLLICWGCLVLSRVLRFLFGGLTAGEVLALGLTGWLVPASLLALLWRILGLIPTLAIFIILTILLIRLPSRSDPAPDSKKITFALLTFLSISILLRLVFVSQAVLPSYFDSAQHYLYIKDILQGGVDSAANYYHLGFHTLVSFLVSTLQTDIAGTMLILGQMILAVIPASLFFLIRYTSQSNMGGLFAVVLAAFGWYMPAHGINWGKYPALMSLGVLPFVFSLAYLLTQHKSELTPRQRGSLYVLLGFSIIVSTLAHTRAVIVLALVFLAWGAALILQRLPSWKRRAALFIVLSIIAVEIVFIQRQPLLAQLLDPYLNRGIWVSVLVVLLSFLAWRSFPQLIWTCLLSVCLLLGGLFIPVPVPGYGTLSLLDRPFVQMILCLPLAMLGGLGLAELGKISFSPVTLKLSPEQISGIAGLLTGGFVVVHALSAYDFYPSNCCVIAGRDDLLAIEWLGESLPAAARIGIPVTAMDVLPAREFEGYNGTDAGIWVTPLAGRVTVGLPVNSDFSQSPVHASLCQREVTHLYVGEIGQTFNLNQLNAHPGWYQVAFTQSKSNVYEVVGCED